MSCASYEIFFMIKISNRDKKIKEKIYYEKKVI